MRGSPRTSVAIVIATCGFVATASVAAPAQPATPEPAAPVPAAPPAATRGLVHGTVRAADTGAPLVGATVAVDGTALAAIADAQGRYAFDAPAGLYTVRAELTGYLPVEALVALTAPGDRALDFELESGRGLRPRTAIAARAGRGSPVVAVTIVPRRELLRGGRRELSLRLAQLVPSLHAAPLPLAEGSSQVTPFAWRGLRCDQVLVLVNGKRRHPSALLHRSGFARGASCVDLDAIPASSLERIELVSDGASWKHSSQAVAGIINLVLDDPTEDEAATAAEATSSAGITTHGDGARLDVAAGYRAQLRDGVSAHLSAELFERQATDRSTLSPTPVGEGAARAGATSFDLRAQLGPRTTAYGFGGAAHRFTRSNSTFIPPVTPTPLEPYPPETQIVPELYPNGFLPEFQGTDIDLFAASGVRGRRAKWTFDASALYGRNTFAFELANSNNASFGSSSPTHFRLGTQGFAHTVVDLDATRTLALPGFSSATLLVGAELSSERYWITAGDPASHELGGALAPGPFPLPKEPRSQPINGFTPSNALDRRRFVAAGYAGVESEVTRGFALDGGARIEYHEELGAKVQGRLAVRHDARYLTWRAAVGTSARAPSQQQRWFNDGEPVMTVDTRGLKIFKNAVLAHNEEAITRALGYGRLRTERSVHGSAGVELAPHQHLTCALHGSYVYVVDHIVETDQKRIHGAWPLTLARAFPALHSASALANIVDTSTLTFDAIANYHGAIGAGSTAVTGVASFARTEITKVHDPSTVKPFKTNAIEDNLVPRVRGALSWTYDRGGFGSLLRTSYYGPVRYGEETYHGKVLVDLELHARLAKGVELSLGAENLLDTYPDQIEQTNTSQFGVAGTLVYGALTWRP